LAQRLTECDVLRVTKRPVRRFVQCRGSGSLTAQFQHVGDFSVVDRNATCRDDRFDNLIIGGGPAGLLAATYLGRFRPRVILVDAGESRAKWIPMTHNCPGFPDGSTGVDLLDRLRQQAVKYGVELVKGTVRDIRLAGADFVATASFPIRARSVLMATGIVDTLPDVPDAVKMIKAGTLRLCPICDGYEVIDRRVAVMGPYEDAMKKALFMRTYSPDVTILLSESAPTLDQNARERLAKARIAVEACTPALITAGDKRARVPLADGRVLEFDTIYPAMGCTSQSKLAIDLGAQCDEVGNIVVDAHQRTVILGLYAAGDIVNELNQIAVAFGHAAIAASDMHNYLADCAPDL
jgi:thioredoxin reductase (NADPH)